MSERTDRFWVDRPTDRYVRGGTQTPGRPRGGPSGARRRRRVGRRARPSGGHLLRRAASGLRRDRRGAPAPPGDARAGRRAECGGEPGAVRTCRRIECGGEPGPVWTCRRAEWGRTADRDDGTHVQGAADRGGVEDARGTRNHGRRRRRRRGHPRRAGLRAGSDRKEGSNVLRCRGVHRLAGSRRRARSVRRDRSRGGCKRGRGRRAGGGETRPPGSRARPRRPDPDLVSRTPPRRYGVIRHGQECFQVMIRGGNSSASYSTGGGEPPCND